MIFSIGYGPHENGKITMNFGALDAAKRRERSGGTVTLCARTEVLQSRWPHRAAAVDAFSPPLFGT